MFEQAAEEMSTPYGGPLGAASTIALTPVAALIDAAKEATKKASPEEMARSEDELSQAMSELAISAYLRDHFLKLTKDKLHYPFRFREVESAASPGVVEYRALASQGIDTILELGVESLRLQRSSHSETTYALFLTARARLLRVADGAVLYDQLLQFHHR